MKPVGSLALNPIQAQPSQPISSGDTLKSALDGLLKGPTSNSPLSSGSSQTKHSGSPNILEPAFKRVVITPEQWEKLKKNKTISEKPHTTLSPKLRAGNPQPSFNLAKNDPKTVQISEEPDKPLPRKRGRPPTKRNQQLLAQQHRKKIEEQSFNTNESTFATSTSSINEALLKLCETSQMKNEEEDNIDDEGEMAPELACLANVGYFSILKGLDR